jgi:hypothetical protein
MRGRGLNDLPRRDLVPRSPHHKGIFFEAPLVRLAQTIIRTNGIRSWPKILSFRMIRKTFGRLHG